MAVSAHRGPEQFTRTAPGIQNDSILKSPSFGCNHYTVMFVQVTALVGDGALQMKMYQVQLPQLCQQVVGPMVAKSSLLQPKPYKDIVQLRWPHGSIISGQFCRVGNGRVRNPNGFRIDGSTAENPQRPGEVLDSLLLITGQGISALRSISKGCRFRVSTASNDPSRSQKNEKWYVNKADRFHAVTAVQ